jgi:hypothetical protein
MRNLICQMELTNVIRVGDDEMTPQHIFNRVVNGLRKQGCKSESGPGICKYRGSNKTRCAAGLLMSNKEYAPWMEGKTIDCLLSKIACPTSLEKKIGSNLDLVRALQSVHDHKDVLNWEKQFKEVAKYYDLVYTPPSGV